MVYYTLFYTVSFVSFSFYIGTRRVCPEAGLAKPIAIRIIVKVSLYKENPSPNLQNLPIFTSFFAKHFFNLQF